VADARGIARHQWQRQLAALAAEGENIIGGAAQRAASSRGRLTLPSRSSGALGGSNGVNKAAEKIKRRKTPHHLRHR